MPVGLDGSRRVIVRSGEVGFEYDPLFKHDNALEKPHRIHRWSRKVRVHVMNTFDAVETSQDESRSEFCQPVTAPLVVEYPLGGQAVTGLGAGFKIDIFERWRTDMTRVLNQHSFEYKSAKSQSAVGERSNDLSAAEALPRFTRMFAWSCRLAFSTMGALAVLCLCAVER